MFNLHQTDPVKIPVLAVRAVPEFVLLGEGQNLYVWHPVSLGGGAPCLSILNSLSVKTENLAIFAVYKFTFVRNLHLPQVMQGIYFSQRLS